MRDFFKGELKTLKIKTGLNQYEKLSELPDAQNQIKLLLDSLVIVCNEFPYIPESDKVRIIQENIIRDQDFQSLNSRVIWKWLNGKKDSYFKELAHIESVSEPPLTGEARDKAIETWLAAVNKMDNNFRVTNDRFKDVREVRNENHASYKPIDADEAMKKQIHLKWIKENFDARTGKPLPTWISEEEWNKLNN